MFVGKIYGHMTAKGNQHAAGLLYEALDDWLPAVTGPITTATTGPRSEGPAQSAAPAAHTGALGQ